MSFTEIKRREIKNYILRKIDDDDESLLSKTADAFGISGTSVKRYIDAELAAGHIGTDEKRKCGVALVFNKTTFQYDMASLTDREDYALYNDVLPVMSVNTNADRIWRYVLPEIFNNAIEHSEGHKIDAYIETSFLYNRVIVSDDGIGIFNKIVTAMKRYGYSNPQPEDAITELYKGKFTTCPERHTGEGIFFSMRMLDKVAIVSDGILLRSGYEGEASFVRSHLLAYAMKLNKKGTVVIMQLENETRRDINEVFDEYSDNEKGFIKTRIPVYEACMDHDPVARSQARRLQNRLNNFEEAVLDFEKVDIMGQGFADELFRVYHNEHPEVTLTPINMNEQVHKMYLHALNTKVTVPDYSDTHLTR